MNSVKKIFIYLITLLIPLNIDASVKKRGLSWEEGKVNINEHFASLLSPGVSWIYNWSTSAANSSIYSEDFSFVPMAWNGNFDESELRNWLKDHRETRYILGFNEPNFADQSNMTPSQAVAIWPKLEKISEDYDVPLVAPALNFSGSSVGGKIWSIYEWYDEFFRLYPEAKVDFLALHCYMNWWSALTWFALEYIYKDLYNPSNENYGKYPNLVGFLDRYRRTHGHFPKMMLTEFCGWEYDYLPDVYFQIDQMTQKVQKLEQSDLVEGYAWFIGNAGRGATEFPYMSVIQTFSNTSNLSELGNIYVHMSSFDKDYYYPANQVIEAKDYIDASMDDCQVKLRLNSESYSSIPLQIELPPRGSVEYLIETTETVSHDFQFHLKTEKNTTLTIYLDELKKGLLHIDNHSGEWTDQITTINVEKGRHKLKISNSGSNSIVMNSFLFLATSSINDIEIPFLNSKIEGIYTINGILLKNLEIERLEKGVYVFRFSDGHYQKFVKK